MNLGIDFIQDKKIEGGCSRRRPDFLFDLFTHTVIVENGHKDYDTNCEIAKLNDTFTDLADRPIVLLRFNPDNYENPEWNRRIKILNKEVKRAIQEIPKELIITTYLIKKIILV